MSNTSCVMILLIRWCMSINTKKRDEVAKALRHKEFEEKTA
jgi:hypothetical protein